MGRPDDGVPAVTLDLGQDDMGDRDGFVLAVGLTPLRGLLRGALPADQPLGPDWLI